ncbi:MAG: hypothetical protein II004_03400 [Erysipelotrichaceae bacterium]|nr:hypothetical protein [Erysipelotrichaceae bacterium]
MKTTMERAKELFLQYNGNRFYMALDGDEYEYDGYQVSKETEEAWRREYLDKFMQQKRYGKDALKAYASAVGFLKSDRSDADWENFLYYPLRSGWLDDVTVLFMLPLSFMLAEKWTDKGRFSKTEAEEYLRTMNEFLKEIQKRAETGTLIRAEDYNRQEFSDPVYAAAYIEDLKRKWLKLK